MVVYLFGKIAIPVMILFNLGKPLKMHEASEYPEASFFCLANPTQKVIIKGSKHPNKYDCQFA